MSPFTPFTKKAPSPSDSATLSNEFDQPSTVRGKTHRGRRSKGKSAHHAAAKTHLANAQAAATPQAATAHLFKALSSLNKAKQSAPNQMQMSNGGM